MPLLALAGMLLGFVSWRRAKAAGRRPRLALAGLALSGTAVVVQLVLWQAIEGWLLPAMERRTTAALTAACEGRFEQAVPEPGGPSISPAQTGPSREDLDAFAAGVRAAMGEVRSIRIVNSNVSGSALAPQVDLALTLQFTQGSCIGSARVQWITPGPDDPQPWLPTSRVLEMEISLSGGQSISLPPAEPKSP